MSALVSDCRFYWSPDPKAAATHLVIPYTLDCNDMRFATPQGFNSGDQFYTYLKDTFDCLLQEGAAGSPKMMSVGLHCRLVGRPGRALALERFLDYVASFGKQARLPPSLPMLPRNISCFQAWVARRIDIARHWRKVNPPPA